MRVKDSTFEAPTLQSVPIVSKFPYIFLEDLLKVPHHREIHYGINVFTIMNPLYIPLY